MNNNDDELDFISLDTVFHDDTIFSKVKSQLTNFGPSEVRVLPVRRCRRAVWQT
jgi:hypothetical protein